MGLKTGGFENRKHKIFDANILNEHIYLYEPRSFKLFFACLFAVSIWLQAAVT